MPLDVSEDDVDIIPSEPVYFLEDLLMNNRALVELCPLSIYRKSLPFDYPDIQRAYAKFRVCSHFNFSKFLFFCMPKARFSEVETWRTIDFLTIFGL